MVATDENSWLRSPASFRRSAFDISEIGEPFVTMGNGDQNVQYFELAVQLLTTGYLHRQP